MDEVGQQEGCLIKASELRRSQIRQQKCPAKEVISEQAAGARAIKTKRQEVRLSRDMVAKGTAKGQQHKKQVSGVRKTLPWGRFL